MKFSLIIPIYKVEKFLTRCINSIEKQTFNDYEVILVDDGSPDSCPGICDSICAQNKKFRVIHKQNEGLGFARNTGMQYANGDYIVFIDSDDYIENNSLEILYNYLKNNSYPDVCVFGHNIINEMGTKISKSKTVDKYFEENEITKYVLPKAFCYSMRKPFDEFGIGSAWGSIYKKDFLLKNSIKFKSEREYLSEDLLFSIEVCMKATSILFINYNLYNYCLNGTSLSHSYRPDRLEKSVYLYKYMKCLVKNHNLSDEILFRTIDNFFVNLIVCLKQEIYSKQNYQYKKNRIKQITNNEEFQSITRSYPIKNLPFQRRFLFMAMRKKIGILVTILILLKEKNNAKGLFR